MNNDHSPLLKWKCLGGFIFNFVFCFSVFAENASSILPDVRERFPIVLEEMCHSSVIYSLDMPFEKAQNLYHKTQNCLFDQSVVRATNSMNKDFKPIFRKFDVNFNPTKLSIQSENCKAGDIFAIQATTPADHGYISRCESDENSNVKEIYSACRVAETAWNEFCAYQEYLEWKKIDDSLEKEFNKQSENYSQREDWTIFKNKILDDIDTEKEKSKKALEESLRQYQHFEQNYRNHLWLEVIKSALNLTKKKTDVLRTAIEKWPKKFHKQASSSCDQ